MLVGICANGTICKHKMTSRVWTGFTDEDIINLQKGNGTQNAKVKKQTTHLRQAKLQGGTKQPPREKLGMPKIGKTPHSYTPIPPQARLSESKEQDYPSSSSPSSEHQSPEHLQSSSQSVSPTPPSPCKSPTGSHAKNVKIRVRENNSYELVSTNGTTTPDQLDNQSESEHLMEEKMDEGSGGRGEGVTLEMFQKRQKMMEEQNRLRREMLAKAIADRSRRTQSEAQKLKQIQVELAKLDSLLSTDVSILRDQIEVASLEFSEAQKRYDKAEREFIEAKLQLFNKLEKKELLTEHLCRIIEANEQRKANKLSELMAKLEMVDVSAELPEPSAGEVLPQLASLDEITYAACTTLKDPKKIALTIQQIQAKNKGDIPKPIPKEEPQNEKGRKDIEDKQEAQDSVGKKRENETVQENKDDSPKEGSVPVKENSTERTKETKESLLQTQAESGKGPSSGDGNNSESSEKDNDKKEIRKEGEEHAEKGILEEAEKGPKEEQGASSLQNIPERISAEEGT
ncbi:RAB6-interacting golgin-like isoform X2 [Penaeus japonicus]|uniref:RAB6-interacting golgin-like isoform X2 n=1 Tax=Penaeus japonicus TaxID=27405 RepID=UPI001C70B8FA|nr:RAB6-interacting golgin-like isoform X2 [Penaeus japonicus]